MRKTITLSFTALAVLTALVGMTAPPSQFSPYVDAAGNISLPQDFRHEMVHLGSWFVPEGDASGFHDVYADSRSVKHYRETGQFPDGGVLVKELRADTKGNFTTGANVSYANQTLKQWFVMIKDTKGRFPNNPIWGDGWGWGLYQPGKVSNVATNYQQDCIGCHTPAKDTDWVYTQAYPTLTKE